MLRAVGCWTRPGAARASRHATAVAALGLLATLSGCGDRAFRAASEAGTAAAYEHYLHAYPQGAHAADAKHRLAALADDADWRAAVAAAGVDSYRGYLARHAAGLHARSALVALAALEMGADSQRSGGAQAEVAGALKVGLVSDIELPAPAPVRGAEGPSPVVGPDDDASASPGDAGIDSVDTGGFRVQLGAFTTGSAAARAAWRRLAATHPYLEARRPLVAAALSREGVPIHRLQLAGFTRESAESLCAALAATGDACVIETPAVIRRR